MKQPTDTHCKLSSEKTNIKLLISLRRAAGTGVVNTPCIPPEGTTKMWTLVVS